MQLQSWFETPRLPASREELMRQLGMIEERSPFDSALAGLALVATGMLLGAGISRMLASRVNGASTVPARDERGVKPLTET